MYVNEILDNQHFTYLVQATRNVTSYEYLGLNISVLFPHTALDTNLDNFITYLPGFRQTFGNLTDVYFKNLVIESAWQDIISTVSGNALFFM